jgi:hypothetical protein
MQTPWSRWLGRFVCFAAPPSWRGRGRTWEGPRSPRQLLAVGVDLAADEARNLLPDTVSTEGPVPVGTEPAGLLRSAEQLLRRVCEFGASAEVDGLHARVVEMVWEANTGAGA